MTLRTIDVARDIEILNASYGVGANFPAHSPYWIQSELYSLTQCDQYRRKQDNLLATAIFDIAVMQNPKNEGLYTTELKRCIVQMDSEPFQRLVGALSELGLREILMEIMRIRHDSTIEPETRFRL